METLTLNDGTVVNGHCLLSSGKLYVYLDEMEMMTGIMMFSDENRIRKITENNRGSEHIYEGYIHLVGASSEFGNCNLVLARSEA